MLTDKEFNKQYDILFNLLRKNCKYDNLAKVIEIRDSLTHAQFLKLLRKRNSLGNTNSAIIHYALHNIETVQILTEHLSVAERTKILRMPFNTGCTALHYAANSHQPRSEYTTAIKKLVYTQEDHTHWVSLLMEQKQTKNDLDSPVHYSARQQLPTLLKIFSEGLNSDEWKKILSVKNAKKLTPMEVYFLNHPWGYQDFNISFRGPLNQDQWVSLLIKNNISKIMKLHIKNELIPLCMQELTKDLSFASINQLLLYFEKNSSSAVVHIQHEEKPLAIAAPKTTPQLIDNLAVLKKMYDHVYRDGEDVELFLQDYKALRNINRNADFWKCMREGFTNGRGELFLEQLKHKGAFQILFPCLNLLNQQQNDAWFLAYMRQIDLYKKKNITRFLDNPFRTNVQVLLVAKELGESPTSDQIINVHRQYQMSVICDDTFQRHVGFINAGKKAVLDGYKSTLVHIDVVPTLTL